jgi:hypothetical protein
MVVSGPLVRGPRLKFGGRWCLQQWPGRRATLFSEAEAQSPKCGKEAAEPATMGAPSPDATRTKSVSSVWITAFTDDSVCAPAHDAEAKLTTGRECQMHG